MNLRPLLIVPPLVIGVLGYMWMTRPQDSDAAAPPVQPLAVRAVTVAPQPITVTATGYGRVEAERSWSAISQVDGRVQSLFPGLAEGTIVQEGDVLVQVDPTDYELAIQKAEANIAATEAGLNELDRQEANTLRSLDLETRILEVAQSEFDRVSDLVERGAGTQASADTAERTLLAQENAVTNLRNQLELYPAQRASQEATLAVRAAELAEAERALANTTIVAPFQGRAASVSIEAGQFVRTGEELLRIEAIETIEVVAAFQPRAFAPVVQSTLGQGFQPTADVEATQVVDILNEIGLTATVRVDFESFEAVYPATLSRFQGTVDNETGTIALAVRVDNPRSVDRDVRRPPLSVGAFVAVDLTTPALADQIAIPRSVLHQDDSGAPFVFTADKEDKLHVTAIQPGPIVGDDILVRSGLNTGDKLILSDPRPPIDGLPLTLILQD